MNVKPIIVSEQKLAAVSRKVAQQYLEEGNPRFWRHHTDKAAMHSRQARVMLFVLIGVERIEAEELA
jgi:hypothetical protein